MNVRMQKNKSKKKDSNKKIISNQNCLKILYNGISRMFFLIDKKNNNQTIKILYECAGCS